MSTPSDAVTTVMGPDVSAAIDARMRAGDAERLEEMAFVPIVTLGSGARLGLTVPFVEPPDDEEEEEEEPAESEAPTAQWAMCVDGKLTPFSAERSIVFAELIESPRADLDGLIERGANELGLPGESVLFSLPVVEIVQAMFEKKRPHFTRLALNWLLPSELRALRKDIGDLVDDALLPRDLRDLAKRLVVPE